MLDSPLFSFSILLISLFLGQVLHSIWSNCTPKLSKFLNRYVIWIALPSLVFQKIIVMPNIRLDDPHIFLPISLPWLHWVLTLIFVGVATYVLNWQKPLWGAFALTVGLGNTSFVGFPLLRVLLGENSLGTGVILDQLGSFLILSSVAAPLAVLLSPFQKTISKKLLLARAVSFPPFLALIIGLGGGLFGKQLGWSGEISPSLSHFLEFNIFLLAPCALISVGMTLQFSALRNPLYRLPLALALAFKLLLFPLFYWFLYTTWAQHFINFQPLVLKTLLLEGWMASMITAGVVATENGYDRDFAQLMVATSVLLSLITVPIWSFVLN